MHMKSCFIIPHKTCCKGSVLSLTVNECVSVENFVGKIEKTLSSVLTIDNLCILRNHYNTCKSNIMEFKVISELFLEISQIIKDIPL